MYLPFTMFDRFTDRARKVMKLAKQQAQRFSHDSIGAEHILLALVDEGNGVAAQVLKNLDVNLRDVQGELENIVQPGANIVTGEISPNSTAEQIIEFAWEESGNLKHNYVGTEHLLLGMLREREGIAGGVLMNFGLNLDNAHREIVKLLGKRD